MSQRLKSIGVGTFYSAFLARNSWLQYCFLGATTWQLSHVGGSLELL